MNFLMNCYTSLFTSVDPFVNRWWEPLPEAKKKGFEAVVRACQANGIQFCFAVHPVLFSERPLVPETPGISRTSGNTTPGCRGWE